MNLLKTKDEILTAMAMLNNRDNSRNTFFNPPMYKANSKRTKTREKAHEEFLHKREESFDTGLSPRATKRRMARSMQERFSELKGKSLTQIVKMLPKEESQV